MPIIVRGPGSTTSPASSKGPRNKWDVHTHNSAPGKPGNDTEEAAVKTKRNLLATYPYGKFSARIPFRSLIAERTSIVYVSPPPPVSVSVQSYCSGGISQQQK